MSNSEDFQDTGMTSVFYQGVNSERERIIQKLRALTTQNFPVLEMHIDDLEELIKGEQK